LSGKSNSSNSQSLTNIPRILSKCFCRPSNQLYTEPSCCQIHQLGTILAQTTYYSHAYFTLLENPSFKPSNRIRFVVPTGNFGKGFESERVSDVQTIETIKEFCSSGAGHKGGYILNPHSAVGVAAALRSMKHTSLTETHHITLATARPAKFANTVDLALKDEKDFSFDTMLPEEFVGLEKRESRVRVVQKGAGWE
jgi:threonine synthase